ncbi:unnamed protein product [Mucor hiemalis]
MTREYYPKDLIKRTQPMYVEIPCSFVEDSEFYDGLFDIICEGDESASKQALVEATVQVFRCNDLFKKFAHSVLQLFVDGVFVEDSDISKKEVSYNFYILWPILNSMTKSIPQTKFKLGEIKLEAISQELKLVNDHRHFYNADGILLNLHHNIEIAILETTGPLLFQNDHKEAQDYIKAGYGLVSMLHVIGRKFYYGDLDIFKRIGVFFVQATPIIVRIWRVSLQLKELHVLSWISSVEEPAGTISFGENATWCQ